MSSSGINYEWKHFLNNTSVRGLKRASETTGSILGFWIFFLLACLTLLLCQVYFVTNNYLELNDAKLTRLRTNTNGRYEFPSVSLCYPFNYHTNMSKILANASLPVHHQRDFGDKLRQLASLFNISANFDSNMFLNYDQIGTFHAQIPAYLIDQLVPTFLEKSILVALKLRNSTLVILQANARLATDNPTEDIKPFSRPQLKVSTFPHKDYLLCYTLELQVDSEFNKEIDSMFLMLQQPQWEFIDKTTERHAFVNSAFFNSRRIRAALHEKQSFPQQYIDKKSISPSPGKLTEIYFDTTVIKKLDCRQDWLNYGYMGQYRYSQSDCQQLKRNALYQKFCNCTIDAYSFRNSDSCHKINWKSPIDSIKYFYKCDMLVNDNINGYSSGLYDCNIPSCRKVEYNVRSQEHEWDVNQFTWYWVFETLVDLGKGRILYLNETNLTRNLSNPQKSYDSRNTIASIKINRGMDGYVTHEEEYISSLSNLFSSIGGACSLSMGVTVTIIGELVELCYRLIKHHQQKSKTTNKDDLIPDSQKVQTMVVVSPNPLSPVFSS